MSVLAFQASETLEVEVADTLRPVGTDGGVVSGGGVTMLSTVTLMTVEVVVLPAASLATDVSW